MSFNNLKLKTKLLLPVVISGLVILFTAAYASVRLSDVTSTAEDIIMHRDAAVAKLLRANRFLVTAEESAYKLLATDSDTPVGRLAEKNFATAIERAPILIEEAAPLLPDHAAQVQAFRGRILAILPSLQRAADIGKAVPGMAHAATLKPDELRQIGDGVGALDKVTFEIEHIVDDMGDFNVALQGETKQRLDDLKTKANIAFWAIVAVGGLGAMLAAGLSIWISSRKVAAPLKDLGETMRKLAGGDVGVDIDGTSRGDEIGDMAKALQVFKANAQEKLRLEAVAAEQRRAAEAERVKLDAVKAEDARKLSEVVANVAGGLDMLSRGKLTHRIDDTFPPEYERLRQDFNEAIAKLQGTLGVVSHNTSAIRSGTREISTAADDLSRRTEQQAANLEETAAAIGQIVAAVHRTSAGATEARDFVMKAKTQADASDVVVRGAVEAMNGISRSSGQIAQIIGVIDEIAFQTNLLALNAGVEAARAGEAGRGFAVVASEVRGLAQRSAEAAKEIKTLIHDSVQQVEHGVDLVGRTGEALAKILKSIDDISVVIQDIAHSAIEQASSLDEINTAVRQMDLFTQQNAAMVEESTAASKGLAGESDELARLISAFEVEASGAEPVRRQLRVARG